MLHFDSDYMRGAHHEVMRRLMETNLEQTVGYGSDDYTGRAEKLILEACGLGIPDSDPKGVTAMAGTDACCGKITGMADVNPIAEGADEMKCTDVGAQMAEDAAIAEGGEQKGSKVVFLVGGTQTNATVIDSFLLSHQGVICAETGHINVHEAGAVEATGHKVLTLPAHEGKVDASELRAYINDFYRDETWEHMVAPGMLYISYPTEVGTLYTLKELEAISNVCKEKRLTLYLDGARLGYGLAAANDLTLKDIARLCDVFYIGGTKCGTLFGEAVVVRDAARWKYSLSQVKRHGALLAKGRLLGVQFEALFTDGLYIRASRNAIARAMRLKAGFTAAGYRLYKDSPTNQQFFIIPNEIIDRLMKVATFELWGPRGATETPVRFVTDWGTTEAEIEELLHYIG